MPSKPFRMKVANKISAKTKSGKIEIRSWSKPDVNLNQAFTENDYTVIMDPDCEIGTPKYDKVESAIIEAGGDILFKNSTPYKDNLIVRLDSKEAEVVAKIDGVYAIGRRPKPKSLNNNLYYPAAQMMCTASDAERQAAILQSIGVPKEQVINSGEGTTIIVWDFLPEDEAAMEIAGELVDRKGGKFELVKTEDTMVDTSRDGYEGQVHGSAVASTCCGKHVGLATGARLIILGIGTETANGLAYVDQIASEGKPTIVNMSWGSVYEVTQDAFNDSRGDLWDVDEAAFAAVQAKHPQLLFVVAAGNDGLNACDKKGPVMCQGYGSRPDYPCLMWPQSRLGQPYGVDDIPFFFVGSITVEPGDPQFGVASYSNYGKCVPVYAGGNVCALNVLRDHPYALEDGSPASDFIGIEGTSFASPLTASIASIYFSNNPKATRLQVAKAIMNDSKSIIEFGSSTKASECHNRFAFVPENPKVAGLGKAGWDLFGGGVKSVGLWLVLITMFLLLGLMVYVMIKKMRGTTKKRSRSHKRKSRR